jgi:opacity protein-like surface antigen
MSMPRARLAAILFAALGAIVPATPATAQSKLLNRLSNPSAIFSSPGAGQVDQAEHIEEEGSKDAVQQTGGVHPGHGPRGEDCDTCLFNAPHDAETVINCPHKCCDWSDHWYVSVSGGWADRDRAHEIPDNRTFTEFGDGFAVNAAIGYRFDILRFEAEYSFMNQEVERAGAGLTPNLALVSKAAGNVSLRALMFNAYTDFQLFDWPWLPYFGAGIGVYQSEINGLYPTFFGGLPAPFPTTPVSATSDIPLAWQFRAGLTRRLGTRTEFFVGYRFFRGDTLTFASAPFATAAAPTFSPNGATVHSAEIGLRVRF